MISIIIRTKNEERWIVSCLRAVFKQNYRDFEVILVDNESTDNTVERARQFNISRVITCKDYKPGLAINMGIREAKGEYIVCLSGHCIPVDDKWLGSLLKNFDAGDVAGVYGRQEPMSFTSDFDKRDLSIVFGLDRKVQKMDSFFHNANSMIRRDLWGKVPFNESITNIEDRLWAQKMLNEGYKIIYEPEASVYHYHGIHQNGDMERCRNVVRILESLEEKPFAKHLDIQNLNIVAIIPVRGPVKYLKHEPLLKYTIESALQAKYIKKTIISTDNPELARLAESLGAEVPFLRDSSLSEDYVDIERVLEYSLNKIESLKIFPDIMVSLEITFPFRPLNLIDSMIEQLVKNGLDSIIAVRRENKSIWKEKEGKIEQIEEGLTPRQFKDATYVGLRGLCCVTHPEFLREASLFGERIGMYEISDPYSSIEVRDDKDFEMAEKLIDSPD